MRILVLQHLAAGHPWYLRELMAAAGCTTVTVRLDLGEPLPPLAQCDGLLVMGGVMQVWQEAEYPWLVDEKRYIRAAVEAGKAYLGVCLGHQLLAAACGGDVALARHPEIGVCPVETLPAARAHAAFAAVSTPDRLQWHVAEVVCPPPGFAVLARSQHCAVQVLASGDKVLSVQYHVEADRDTVPSWCAIPAAREALEQAQGADAAENFQRRTLAVLPELQAHARALFGAWLQAARRV
ncbi:MAG: type 1 glutamine amidotransferase [Gammaproteobacteria bacterium]